MARREREGRDLGLQGVVDWLTDWADGDLEVEVNPVRLTCPAVHFLPLAEQARHSKLLSKNQSELHSYLKFSAMRWLEKQCDPTESVVSEQRYYTPDYELCEGIQYYDQHKCLYDLKTPRLLDVDEDFPLSFGMLFRFDLFGSQTIVEVGATQPASLLIPLFDGMAMRSVWFPFPYGLNTRTFKTAHGPIMNARGYEIWRSD